MELILELTEDDSDFKTYKLCDATGNHIVSFDVEINKDTALISYETQEQFRNQGYASRGLNLLRGLLFDDENILFLELINLSGDYSRKVAENACFFSRSTAMKYYIALNPCAEQILNSRMDSINSSTIKKNQRLLEKVNTLRQAESLSKQEMQNKLDSLLQQKEIETSIEYKTLLESEISHLQKILTNTPNQEIKKL